jgi:DNA primase
MPDAKDPDEYLQKHSKQEFEQLIEKAPDFFRWWAQSVKKKFQGAPIEERLRSLQGFVPMILQIPNEISVQTACATVESELGLTARDLIEIVNAERKKGSGRKVTTEAQTQKPAEPGSSKEEKADVQMEADFLALLTEERGEFVPWAKDELLPEVFTRENFRQLFEKLCGGEMRVEELNQVPELGPSFIQIESRTEKKHREGMLIDLAQALKKRHLKRQMSELKLRQTEAEKAGEAEEALRLAQQMVLLKRQFSQGVESK